LLDFVGNAPWSDAAMLDKARELVLPVIECGGPIEAWIIDDTGFPKKGRHSVGVTRQYCGQLGKQDNCQVAVTLSLASRDASLPVAYRLDLPEDWAKCVEKGLHRGLAEAPAALMWSPIIVQSGEITPIRSRNLRFFTRGIRGSGVLFMSTR
jgi:DDE superfamily endonuclease